MAKKIFIVAHPKLFLKVDGKLSRQAKGTEVKMEAKSAESLVKQGKLLVKGAVKAAEIDEADENEDNEDNDSED